MDGDLVSCPVFFFPFFNSLWSAGSVVYCSVLGKLVVGGLIERCIVQFKMIEVHLAPFRPSTTANIEFIEFHNAFSCFLSLSSALPGSPPPRT